MRELLPGLYHWRVFHDDIQGDVDCYYGVSEGVGYVLDPLTPEGGLDVLRRLPQPPSHIYMTNRLHDRSCAEFAAAFDAPIWCNRRGLHEYADGSLDLTGFDAGQDLPGGIRTIEVGIICADETALLLPIDVGVLAIADSFIRYPDSDGNRAIGFVPDDLIGENAESVKVETRTRFLQLCDDLDFDHLLFAHGEPVIGGGKQDLRAFCEA